MGKLGAQRPSSYECNSGKFKTLPEINVVGPVFEEEVLVRIAADREEVRLVGFNVGGAYRACRWSLRSADTAKILRSPMLSNGNLPLYFQLSDEN